MSLFYRLATSFVRILMRLFWNYKIVNNERLKKTDSCIIAPNHISALDPPFIGSIIPTEIFILAKYELFQIPLLGLMIRNLNAIPIKRGRIDRKAIKKAKDILTKGYSLIMFPEGTRSSTKVKAGIGKIAFETQKNIVPVFIEYPSSLLKSFFKKESLNIVIGEQIDITRFEKVGKKTVIYREIAEFTMNKIRELENEN